MDSWIKDTSLINQDIVFYSNYMYIETCKKKTTFEMIEDTSKLGYCFCTNYTREQYNLSTSEVKKPIIDHDIVVSQECLWYKGPCMAALEYYQIIRFNMYSSSPRKKKKESYYFRSMLCSVSGVHGLFCVHIIP